MFGGGGLGVSCSATLLAVAIVVGGIDDGAIIGGTTSSRHLCARGTRFGMLVSSSPSSFTSCINRRHFGAGSSTNGSLIIGDPPVWGGSPPLFFDGSMTSHLLAALTSTSGVGALCSSSSSLLTYV